MESQHHIKRTLSGAIAIAEISDILAQGEVKHRTDLARGLCERHKFYDARGRPQLPGCLKALSELSAAGYFELLRRALGPGSAPPSGCRHRFLCRQGYPIPPGRFKTSR